MKESHVSPVVPREDEEVICPFSVQQNVLRFAKRHGAEKLADIASQYKYVGYSNFDEKEHPDGDFV